MARVDVSLERVSVSYGAVTPIRALSLEVLEGEFLALLGPSGCGKTTTLRVLAGFVTPTEGEVRVRGESMRGVPPHRRNIGMVYQDYALFPHMTVRDNVGFGLRMRKTPATRAAAAVAEVLALLQLDGLADRYPTQLSGGQQQRVALARALVFKPAVLLLDEPLAALDRKLRAEMQFELRRLQRSVGITTIFVTHDQEEALSLADRVAVLSDGRILQVGTPREVYDRPADRFVAEFIGTANFFRARVTAREGSYVRGALDGGEACTIPLPESAAPEVDVMVRPERIRLALAGSPGSEASANRLRGRVVSAIYVGTGVKYQVEVPSGQIVRVDAPPEVGTTIGAGTAVELSFAADDARVFARTS